LDTVPAQRWLLLQAAPAPGSDARPGRPRAVVRISSPKAKGEQDRSMSRVARAVSRRESQGLMKVFVAADTVLR
jgi:hypothetical protein